MDECAIDHVFANLMMRKFQVTDTRVQTALAKTMEMMRSGHVCVSTEDVPELNYLPSAMVADADPTKLFVREGSMYYLQRHWILETRLVKPVVSRLSSAVGDVEMPTFDGLNAEQANAVRRSLCASFFVLAGGPGTGKTYTARRMIEAQQSAKRIAIAAPTGKAVAKLKASFENIDKHVDALTLHRLLGVKRTGDQVKDAKSLSYDIVLIDECSMIDLAMWGLLFESLKPNTKLFLLGDPEQLPSVEPGNFFEDLWHVIKTRPNYGEMLTQCMRTQCADIMQCVSWIKNEQVEDVQKASGDFCVQGLPTVHDLIKDLHPMFRGGDVDINALDHCQILSVLRHGPLGVKRLNQLIWDEIEKDLQVGDQICIPIMITKNAIDVDLSNGQIGVWVHQYKNKTEDVVLFKDREPMPFALVPTHELAYVISVHKSQGSEYDTVKVILPPGSERFGKKVLYTAVTRARKKVVVYTDGDTLSLCITNKSVRTSNLAPRLLELLE